MISDAGWSGQPSEIRSAEVNLDTQHDGFNLVETRFDPAQHVMLVYWNNQIMLRHLLDFPITTPAQIKLGLDSTFLVKRRFPSRMSAMMREIT